MLEVFDFEEFPIIETKRLLMRELKEADATTLFEYYSDPEFTRYIAFDSFVTIEDSIRFINFMRDIYRQRDSIRWGIESKQTGILLGNAGLHFWKRDIRCSEVGYHIGQAYQGQGFATEALTAMLEFGFKRMNLNRIQGYINTGNKASGRVMEKLNFTKEGTWRQVEIKNGVFVDKIGYSLLREEYSTKHE